MILSINLKEKLDYSKFFNDKDLTESLENIQFQGMQNRVLFGKIQKQSYWTKKKGPKTSIKGIDPKMLEQLSKMENMESIVSLEKDSNQNILGNMVSGLVAAITSGKHYYIFLISQKPLNNINEEYFTIDDQIVEKGVLGDPLEFNKIFFYTYSGEGDNSGPKRVLGVENIQSVNAIIYKGSYYLKIKLENGKLYFFYFKHAIPVCYWLNGLRKAVRIKNEFDRSKYGVLKYNIEILCKYHENNKWVEINEVLDGITNGLNSNLMIENFVDQLENAVKEINYFCDAFFAYKPFIPSLFEALIQNIHVSIRTTMMDFWNKNYLEMIAGDILGFGRGIRKYQKLLEHWGVYDGKLTESLKPIIITFVNRLFDNSKEILFNVIDEAMFKFRLENKKYKNDSIRILEAHINICFDNYSLLPTMDMAIILIDMLITLITIVQINLITQLQNPEKNLDLEVLASLLNNNFDDLVQKFMKKIHKKTKSEISLKEIREMVNYEYLQRNNLKLSMECLNTTNSKIALEIDNMFYSQKKPFYKFDLQKMLDSIEKKLGPIFLGLSKEYIKFDLIDKISLQIIHLYFKDFVLFAKKMKHRHIEKLLLKIPEDRQRLLNYFRPFVGHEIDCHIEILKDIKEFLETDDYEKARILILKFIAFFGKQYGEPENIKKLTSSKLYFSKKQILQLEEDLNKMREEHKNALKKHQKVKRYIKKFNPKVRQFVNILKTRLNKKNKKSRSTTLNFRPQNTELMLYSFSVDEIFAFSAKCQFIEFPIDIDDLEIEEFLNKYLEKKKK